MTNCLTMPKAIRENEKHVQQQHFIHARYVLNKKVMQTNFSRFFFVFFFWNSHSIIQERCNIFENSFSSFSCVYLLFSIILKNLFISYDATHEGHVCSISEGKTFKFVLKIRWDWEICLLKERSIINSLRNILYCTAAVDP